MLGDKNKSELNETSPLRQLDFTVFTLFHLVCFRGNGPVPLPGTLLCFWLEGLDLDQVRTYVLTNLASFFSASLTGTFLLLFDVSQHGDVTEPRNVSHGLGPERGIVGSVV